MNIYLKAILINSQRRQKRQKCFLFIIITEYIFRNSISIIIVADMKLRYQEENKIRVTYRYDDIFRNCKRMTLNLSELIRNLVKQLNINKFFKLSSIPAFVVR